MSSASPETLQPEDWAGEMGERWNRYIDQFESMITPAGGAAIEFSEFRKGETVIDIGCGGGASTFEIAKRVGPQGRATGVDISATLIRTARQRQQALRIGNADFVVADAATADFDAQYDCLFSRFGVMFFEDPHAAFTNLARALKPGGRASLCVWGPPQANPWVGNLLEVLGRHIELPPRDPHDPGPFAFGDREYLRDILDKAGFTDIEFTIWKGDQYVGGMGADAEQATAFALEATFIGDLLAEASAETKQSVQQELIEMLRQRETEHGVVMKGTTWLVAARV